MGWDFSHRDKGMTTKDFMQREFGAERPILASGVVDGVFYAAVQNGDEVFGAVVLMQRAKDYFNFGYKAMDDAMGPWESQAPAKVLDLLTPTDNENANEWRARCRANLAKVLKKGDKVRFAERLSFTNGASLDTFTYAGRNTFLSEGRQPYSIPRWKNRAFEVLVEVVA